MSVPEEVTRITDTSSEKKGRFKVKNVKPNGETQDLSIQNMKSDSSHSNIEFQRSSTLTGTVTSSSQVQAALKHTDSNAGSANIQIRSPQPASLVKNQHQSIAPVPLSNMTGHMQGQGSGQLTALSYPTEKETLNVALISGTVLAASPPSKALAPTPPAVPGTATAPPAIPKKSRFTVKTIPVVEEETDEILKGEGNNQGLGQGRQVIQGQGQGQLVHPTGSAQMTSINAENPAQMLYRLEQLFEMNAQMLSRVIEATKLNQRGESTSTSPNIYISGEKQNHSQSLASSGTYLPPQLLTPVPVPAATPPHKLITHGQGHSAGGSPPQAILSTTEGSSNRQNHGHGHGQGQTLVQSQSQGVGGPGPGLGHYSISQSNSGVSSSGIVPPILTGILTKRPTSAGSTRQSMSVTTTSQQAQFQPYIHLNQNPGQDGGSIFDVTSPTGTPPIPPPSSIQRPLSSATSPNVSSGINMGAINSNSMSSSVSPPSGSGSGSATSYSMGSGGLSTSATYMNANSNSNNNSNSGGSSNSGSLGFPSGSGIGGTGSGTGSGVLSPMGITSPLSGPTGSNPGPGQGSSSSGLVSGLVSSQGQGDSRGQQGHFQSVSVSSGMSSTSLIANNEKDKSSAFGKLFHYMNEMKKELESAQKQRREGQLETQRLREKCQQLDDRLEMEQSRSAGLEDRLDRGKSAQRTLRLQVEAQAAQIEALLEALAQPSAETVQQHDNDRDSTRQPD